MRIGIFTVDTSLIDALIKKYDPEKVVIFVSAEKEDVERAEYERVYREYGDKITLYAGDVDVDTRLYSEQHDLYFCEYGDTEK